MKMSPVDCASPSTVITHQLELFFCLLLMIIAAIFIKLRDIDNDVEIILIFLPSDKVHMSHSVIISLP